MYEQFTSCTVHPFLLKTKTMATKTKETITTDTAPSPGVQTVPVISFDLGNRFNALTDGVKTVSFPSYSNRLSPNQDLHYDSVDFVEGRSFRVDIGAQSFTVGNIAGVFAARPTFSGEKWLKAKEFLFAGLAALGLDTTAVVSELRCSIPDDQDLSQRTPFETLADKTHQFKVNGIEYTIRIDRVRIVAEGKTAWLRAMKEGLFRYPGSLNGVLDLGGGTAIARLIAPDGTIARDYEKVLKGGTSQLAAEIAAECRLLGVEGKIMDAIADGSFAVNAYDFRAAYEALLPHWVSGIRGELNTAWRPIENHYGQILIVGGSAPIFAPFVKENPRYIPVANPQFFALEGLQNG
jgi:hypothetical protein